MFKCQIFHTTTLLSKNKTYISIHFWISLTSIVILSCDFKFFYCMLLGNLSLIFQNFFYNHFKLNQVSLFNIFHLLCFKLFTLIFRFSFFINTAKKLSKFFNFFKKNILTSEKFKLNSLN